LACKTATRSGNRNGNQKRQKEEESGRGKIKKRGGRIFCPKVRGENSGGTKPEVSLRIAGGRGALTGTADVYL